MEKHWVTFFANLFGQVRHTFSTDASQARLPYGLPARALPLVFGRRLSYKIQVKGLCEDLEECK